MVEEEWFACTEPEPMLAFLRGLDRVLSSRPAKGQTAGRKLRLFACACCRCIWHLLTDDCGRLVIEVSERYADGLLLQKELRAAYELSVWGRRPSLYSGGTRPSEAQWVAVDATTPAVEDYRLLASSAARAAYAAGIEAGPSAVAAQQARQAALLRDIFNPFRRVPLDRIWRTPLVTALARAAYQERLMPQGELDLARLGVLADALEEAGCTEQAMLEHLRAPGPHVRGCWAIDAVMCDG